MRRTRVAIFVHLIWATWDRLPWLTGAIESAVHRAIGAKCVELGTDVLAIGGIEDHVHLLARLPATLAVADLVKHLKGASAHLVTHQLAPDQPFRWQGSYGAFSISLDHLDPLGRYIARQREHHALGTVVTAWAEWDDG